MMNYNNYLNKIVENYHYTLNPQSEIKTVLKIFHGQPRQLLEGDLRYEVNVGQTGSFHDQRIKDAFPEAVISFGRFRLFSGKY